MYGISGRTIGGAFGATAYPSTIDYIKVQENFALAALVMAVIYFLLYHFYLKPKCAAPVVEATRPSPALIQGDQTSQCFKKHCIILF